MIICPNYQMSHARCRPLRDVLAYTPLQSSDLYIRSYHLNEKYVQSVHLETVLWVRSTDCVVNRSDHEQHKRKCADPFANNPTC